MKFVVELSKSVKFNTVIMVIYSILKRMYFILTYIIVTIESTVRLFLHYVWKLHSLPTCVILDRDIQFIAHFTKELYYMFGIEIVLSIV